MAGCSSADSAVMGSKRNLKTGRWAGISRDQYDEETPKYTSTASEEIRKIGLFDTQRIEFEDNKEPKKHGRYKGRRFK